ncbi:hypothetical protein [Gluconobacter sp. Gdi]|uniref:hypothetical protein n=1 Tax=Gluconobacter sp. Gdi TaxID=2691888 RepID=UPI00176CC936|nr:hypothetical protein [Gluconobacter sp. Gdi]GFE97779.1 hypothetical protein DmGdi_28520 [Gluconobacter sp. Gdi]
MTRIILQHGQNAPLTLDIEEGSTAPIHLHFSQALPVAAPQAEIAPVGSQAAPASRIRRFLPVAATAAVCAGLLYTFGGLHASAPVMPESAPLPPLPSSGPLETQPQAQAPTAPQQILKALHQPAHVEMPPSAPAQAGSPFGLEN